MKPQTLWFYKDVGHMQAAKKEILAALQFEELEDVFITPKPTKIIERILQIASNPNPTEPDIILDSFAGPGTTAHAVLNLNQSNGGSRRFIQMAARAA